MPFTTHKVGLMLACLACASCGRRLPSARGWQPSAGVNQTSGRRTDAGANRSLEALGVLLIAFGQADAFNPSALGARVPTSNPCCSAAHEIVLHRQRCLDCSAQRATRMTDESEAAAALAKENAARAEAFKSKLQGGTGAQASVGAEAAEKAMTPEEAEMAEEVEADSMLEAAAAAGSAEGGSEYQQLKAQYELVKDQADEETRADIEARLQELWQLENVREKVKERESALAEGKEVAEDAEVDMDDDNYEAPSLFDDDDGPPSSVEETEEKEPQVDDSVPATSNLDKFLEGEEVKPQIRVKESSSEPNPVANFFSSLLSGPKEEAAEVEEPVAEDQPPKKGKRSYEDVKSEMKAGLGWFKAPAEEPADETPSTADEDYEPPVIDVPEELADESYIEEEDVPNPVAEFFSSAASSVSESVSSAVEGAITEAAALPGRLAEQVREGAKESISQTVSSTKDKVESARQKREELKNKLNK
mmetsp:Transcript_39953/g.72882  ORF Transcript_39953/g.72882 Transcript_39953/m.72882 type:complete len:477 (-) Transcript_39953:128-1558(-)